MQNDDVALSFCAFGLLHEQEGRSRREQPAVLLWHYVRGCLVFFLPLGVKMRLKYYSTNNKKRPLNINMCSGRIKMTASDYFK